MIPPFLATTAAKIGASLGLVAVLTLGYFGWREYQQRVGYAEAETQFLRRAMAQQQEAVGQFIVREQLKLLTVERTAKHKDRMNAQLRQSYQDVLALAAQRETNEEAHETTTTIRETARQDCLVDPALVRAINGMARVLDAAAADRAPAAGGAAGQPAL